MSKAREKIIALALEKHPGISKENAGRIADQILKEEREKIRKESQGGGGSDIKSRIKRKAGLK